MTETKKPEVLAIIPARGGSKGIPRKNIIDLCGKPLIAYSIEVALNTELIDRVIVSTEDEEIAEISRHHGAEVPFLRPKELAGDRSSLRDAVAFTLDRIKSHHYRPQISVTLFPTHLFRTPKILNFLIDKLIGGYSVVSTVKKVIHNSYSVFSIDKNAKLIPLLASGKDKTNDIAYFRPYGTFIGTNILGNQKVYNHTLENPIELIDIDTYRELHLAEAVIQNKMFDFDIGNNQNKYMNLFN